jgi:hypothetical protein
MTTISTVFPFPSRPAATRRRWLRTTAAVAERETVEFTFGNRRPGSLGFARWTACVGQRIADHGLAANARDIDSLVGAALTAGVVPAAVGVLADPAEPDVARFRAFAVVASALRTQNR